MNKLFVCFAFAIFLIAVPLNVSPWGQIGDECDLCEPVPTFDCGIYGYLIYAEPKGSFCIGRTCHAEWEYLCYHEAFPMVYKPKIKTFSIDGCCSAPAL